MRAIQQPQNQNVAQGNSGIGVQNSQQTSSTTGPGQAAANANPPLVMPQSTEEHIIRGRFTGTYISGCHNKDNFETMINATQGLSIESGPIPSTVSGIYEYKYKFNGGKERTKTVYDPKVFSDAHMVNLGMQAAQNGTRSGAAFSGVAGGITFNGYITGNTITTAYPVI